MTILLNILVIWCLISVPVSLLAGHIIRHRGLAFAQPVPQAAHAPRVVVVKYESL